MAEIKVLSQAVADKIAAGEVVERPSAVVKELVENSIDAGASRINVEIKNGGIKYISIEDNGKGIPEGELECAFLRHATSKLRDIDDLFEIATMGFRGEALASICAVAKVTVVSRTADSGVGSFMTVNHGVAAPKEEVACNLGTTMTVEDLFANVPARMKFLKKDATETSYVTDVLGRIALANPKIAFRYTADGKEVFSTSGDGQLKNVVLNIYGIDHAKALMEVDYAEHGVRVHGVLGKAELARGNRTRQTLLVNGRYIKNHVVAKVVEEAFRNVLMTGKFPFFVLNIELSPQLVDVNVHPAKTEIKFANEKEIYNIVHCAVKNAIYSCKDEKSGVASRQFSAKTTAYTPSAVKTTATTGVKSPAVSTGLEGFTAPTGVKSPLEEMLDRDEARRAGRGQTSANDRKKDRELPDSRIIKEFMENTIPNRSNQTEESGYAFNELDPASKKSLDERLAEIDAAKTEGEQPIKLQFSQTATNDLPGKKADVDLTSASKPLAEAEALSEIIDGFSQQMPPTRVIGQAFDTYVIAEKGDEMFLIDQHAAHERKRFETLKADYLSKGVSGQLLLVPIVLDVDPVELQAVKENIETLKNMGFDIEEFGRGSIIIRETPLIGDEGDIKDLAAEVISVLVDNRRTGLLSFEERLLDTVSCKYAIKANKRLSGVEMEGIVKTVEELEEAGITTCPHGRPIKITFTKKEIEKLFKRIV